MKTFNKTCTTIIVILFSSLVCISYATDLRWFGVGNGNWNDATKWRFTNNIPCGCIPTSSDNVQIINGSVTVPNGITANARTIEINPDAELHVGTNSLTVSTLNVGPANADGIVVQQNGLLEVHTNDVLNIEGITNSLVNISALKNSGKVEIVGSKSELNIENSGADGIYNSGQGADFTNHGMVTIDNLVLSGSDGIFNGLNGSVTNEASGVININDVSDSQSEGIDNRYAFLNFGTINVTDIQNASGVSTALHPSAIFANHGNLNITTIKSRGIWVHSDGQFLNKPNGKITIMDIQGEDAIEVLQTFENEGIINITNVNGADAEAIDTRRTFVNTGQINIETINDSHAILNTAFFTNDTGSLIDIEVFDDAGFRNGANGTLTNDGKIVINQNQGVAGSHGIHNLGDIINNNRVTVSRIFGLDSEGILNEGNITGNIARFTIHTVSDSGIQNTTGAIFNVTGAVFDIMTSDIGIENAGTFTFGGTGSIIDCQDYGIYNSGTTGKVVLNDGDLTIDGSSIAGLYSRFGKFTISDCFELTIRDKIELAVLTSFTNNGFIFQDFNNVNATNTTAIAINNGVIEDRKQSFKTGISLFVNNGLYAGPLEGAYVIGFPHQGVLLGKQTGLTKSHYFAESALMNGVGLVTTAIHEWVPSAIVDVVYMQVSNGCLTRVIQQDLNGFSYFECDLVPAAQRQIDYAPIDPSKGWFYPYNWNRNQVPTFCLDVKIDNPHSIVVDPAYLGMGKTLDVSLGVELDVAGEMHIKYFDQSPPN